MKVVIIGGGIAGLSAAHFLADYPEIEIELYESQADIGGQARSRFGKYCFIEYSWRIFGGTYHNFNKIITQLGIDDNFVPVNPCLIDLKDIEKSGKFFVSDLAKVLIANGDIKFANKLAELSTMCRERAINDYHDVSALDYFDQNMILPTLIGPYLGLEPTKLSLSAFYKVILALVDRNHSMTRITKYPTRETLFIPWENYLKSKGVKIFVNSPVQSINIENNRVSNVTINGNNITSEQFIFACSLKNFNRLLDNTQFFNNLSIKNNLKQLESGLQLYYTINMYFSISLEHKSELKCNELTLTNTPWRLVIQRKYLWGDKFLKECNQPIKDVFNVAFIDNIKGSLYGKTLSECTREEAIEEGIYQFKTNQYIQNLFAEHQVKFEDVFLGYEDWYEYHNDPKTGKLVVDNPKFSVNVGLSKYMPKNSHPEELPENMFLAGYYVESSMGGANMEASCETGLNAALDLIRQNGLVPKDLPFNHNVEYFTLLTIGLVYIDKLLYKLNLKNLSTIIPALILILLYLLFIILIIVVILLKLNKSKK